MPCSFHRGRARSRDPRGSQPVPVVFAVRLQRQPSNRQRWKQVYVARAFGRVGARVQVWTVIRNTAEAARSALRELLIVKLGVRFASGEPYAVLVRRW